MTAKTTTTTTLPLCELERIMEDGTVSFPRMVCYKMVGLDTALVWTYLDLAHSR